MALATFALAWAPSDLVAQAGVGAMAQQQQMQQLRTHQQIGDMANSVSGAAQQMTRAMEGLRQMAQDPNRNWAGEAEGEMLRLREHLHQVTGELEEGLQIMERLRERLNQGSQGSGGEEN